ncbi:hypothetical protein [Candidatus Enterococcus ferrettii]|uniref:Uncharacterized protein n=1 Tax=Candidatus Enterococcus ferrettii TaxID=2815324 RepID=A0ABV0EKH4_9ENTE|nr:hypothetical protein [Enterococcus sp. 665A]MBO1341852.1 hypothetical protein [Enterococcus sp. 665A]
MEKLELYKQKIHQLERLLAEIDEINKFEKQLDRTLRSILNNEPDDFFNIKIGTGFYTSSFELNAKGKYTGLIKNIVALMKADLNRKKLEIMDEIERDFGGIE